MFGLLSVNVSAEKLKLPKCDNKSTCVDDKSFYVEVKRVVRRGEVVIVQVVYTGKVYGTFNAYFYSGYAVILDAQGNEFKINGKNISKFHIKEGEKKVVSLKFRGDEKKKIVEPFDLTIKAQAPHGEITLFDLKQDSRFRKSSSEVFHEQ